MIQVSIFMENGHISGFDCVGHAGYAASGHDIVCAGVSTLVINTINSIETFTNDKFDYSEHEGDVRFRLRREPNPETELLLKSLQLGLQTIESDYASRYIKVTIVDC